MKKCFCKNLYTLGEEKENENETKDSRSFVKKLKDALPTGALWKDDLDELLRFEECEKWLFKSTLPSFPLEGRHAAHLKEYEIIQRKVASYDPNKETNINWWKMMGIWGIFS